MEDSVLKKRFSGILPATCNSQIMSGLYPDFCGEDPVSLGHHGPIALCEDAIQFDEQYLPRTYCQLWTPFLLFL